jgi:glycosyltransferase involved in cell wall biosynthesis
METMESPTNVDQQETRERIRVLIVSSTLHVGGAEQVASLLARHVDRRRFEVTACYLKENGVVGHAMQQAGVELIPITRHAPGKVDYFTSFRLLREIARRRPHIVHSHDVHALLDCTVSRLLRPSLRHVHTFHFGNYPHKSVTSHRIERLTWRMPDALVAVGHRQAAAIARTYGIDPGRFRVIWNGVSTPQAEITADLARICSNAVRPIVMSISTLIEQKGLPVLLDAFALLRNSGRAFTLLIVGDGSLRSQLERQIVELGLASNVCLLGWIPDASRCALPACDIFVQSSLWEAMSVVVLEAMATARPIVLTQVGENPNTLRDGVNALLVPPGDSRQLADALARLIDDPAFAQRLGAGARARYEESFTEQHMVRQYEDLYHELVRRPNTASARPAR